jgi:hypothetical protein
MNAYFDVKEPYYLPQYTPVAKELKSLGVNCVFVFYGRQGQTFQQEVEGGYHVLWVKDEHQARQLYLAERPDWLVIGNYFQNLEGIHKYTKTALLSHGIGPKACYYTVSDARPSVRFVEGPYRTQRLQDLYPEQEFVDTGYAKLDPAISGDMIGLKPADYGLDDNKKTILYAPTFYPSSIECFSKNFAQEYSGYNIILKPHYFSLVSEKYKKQRKLLELWAKNDNVYLAREDEVNILPFMAVADVLISDASSTLFEFAALDKPVVWCDFYKLRWGYRGLLRFRFKGRMDDDLYKYADIAVHAKNYKELKTVVDSQVRSPDEFKSARQKYTVALAGVVDGKVGGRIASYMLKNNEIK